MSKQTLQIVLRDDVENLGRSGELVRVKPGFARNYLLPRGLAAVATHANVAQIEHEKKAAISRGIKLRAEAETRKAQLEAVSLVLEAQAGDTGRLFGSIGNKEIAAAFKAKGVDVDRKKILLSDPIKELGLHEISIKLGYEVNATVNVSVNKQAD